MRLQLTEEARKDYLEAKEWYEEIDSELGKYFESVIETSLNKVKANPIQNQKISGDTRKAVVQKFPFNLFYIISNDLIVVTAILHQRRDPKHWQR